MSDPSTNTMVLTGGLFNRETVARYDGLGWVEDLPPLLVGRHGHGCAAYNKHGDGEQVG